jgi:hypothetical protein
VANERKKDRLDADRNPDPITGAPGSHPVATGTGAVGGALAGGAAGAALGGPVGAAIGGVAGAVAGGAAGHAVGEAVDPTLEDAYWRANYQSRPYVDASKPYSEYQNAYRYGWESRSANPDKSWDAAQNDLERGWDRAKGKSQLAWRDAKSATRDAWHRVERALPGDADRDGR